MIKKAAGAFGLIMLAWVLIDPESAGEFLRYAGQSIIAALRSAGNEG